MTPVLGAKWIMKEDLTPIEWNSKVKAGQMKPEWADEIKQNVQKDVLGVPPIAPDLYDFGKQIARLARIALIAQAMGDDESYELAATSLPEFLEPWLQGENLDALVYDESWGGVVTSFGLEDSYADFGHAWFNDHHFQQGYVVYAVAVAARHDPSFYETFKDSVDFIVDDFACMVTNSPNFPIARHKDFFDWHSWASGLFPSGNGKSQESISEAVNAYYAVSLLGDATHNPKLRDWGRLLAHMEIKAGHHYWQMDSQNDVYSGSAELFARNKMAGVVAALDVTARTWFGDNTEYVHGINMMPFTPITEYLLRPSFVKEEYKYLESFIEDPEQDNPADEWLSFIYLDQAIIDPQAAWDKIVRMDRLDGGNSMTNSLYWIATRPGAVKGQRDD